MADADILDRNRRSAPDLAALEALRVSAARQVGRDHRQAQVARRDGRRDARGRGAEDPRAARGGHRRASPSARRRSKRPSSSASSRPRRSTCRCPRRRAPHGTVHPVSQVMDELAEIFADLGFSVAEGPEIEDQWYNFTALNMPENHPARAMQDTFYLEPRRRARTSRMVLRTHTSPVQIRTMEAHGAADPDHRARAASTAPTATRPTRRCSTRSRGW